MRCLILVASLVRAGAETQAVILANGLARQGHEVHLCSYEKQLDQRNRLSDQVHFHHVPRRSKFDAGLIGGVAALIDRERIEVVQGVLLFASFVAMLASARSRRHPPVVAAVHTTVNRAMKEEVLERLIFAPMLRRLPATIFVCERQRDYWVHRHPSLRDRAHVVYNGIEPDRFDVHTLEAGVRQTREALGVPVDAIMISCVAAFRPEKAHGLLVNAFSKVAEPSCLVLIGDGNGRTEIETRISEMGLKDRVRMVGSVADVRPYIAASDATVLSSTAVETFSMAMLESMALGVPVIAPDIGGLSEAIADGVNGRLFPIGDGDELARCMQSLVSNTAQYRRMGVAARRTVLEKFTVANMVASNERVLTGVLGSLKPHVG